MGGRMDGRTAECGTGMLGYDADIMNNTQCLHTKLNMVWYRKTILPPYQKEVYTLLQEAYLMPLEGYRDSEYIIQN